MKSRIKLSDHFSYGRLIRFTLPSVLMMVFTSIYGVVDGFFVSNFAGEMSFKAVNLIMPFLMILSTVGFMLGTGGSAIVAKTLGEGKEELANRYFSLFVYIAIPIGILLSGVGFAILRPLSKLLGAKGELLELCVKYGRIILIGNTFFILQMAFQSFMTIAEKPKLGFLVTFIAGVTNMVLDALLVAVVPLGIEGAAIATVISQVVGGVLPMIYFFCKNNSLLRLGKTKFYGRALLKACVNGSSEFMSNVSMSIVGMMYNTQLLKYVGEDGIAAYGVMMYVSMIFSAAMIGYSIGSAPIISFHYGAQNRDELKSLLKKSSVLVGIVSVVMVGLAQALAHPLALLFVGYNPTLTQLTEHGFRIFAISFLFMGFAIFSSGFFTALNDGVVSAVISFLRTLVFQIAAVMLLPLAMGVDGIWTSIVIAELMAAVISAIFIVCKRKKYGYWQNIKKSEQTSEVENLTEQE